MIAPEDENAAGLLGGGTYDHEQALFFAARAMIEADPIADEAEIMRRAQELAGDILAEMNYQLQSRLEQVAERHRFGEGWRLVGVGDERPGMN